MMRRLRLLQCCVLGMLTMATVATGAGAQSASGSAIQLSGRWTTKAELGSIDLDELSQDNRLSWEGQYMVTRGKGTVGLGISQTKLLSNTDFSLNQTDFFLEYRYLVGSFANRVGAYLAGRVAVGSYSIKCSSDMQYVGGSSVCDAGESPSTLVGGGGGGLLIALSDAMAIDVGAQYYALNRWTMKDAEWKKPNRPHGMLRAGMTYSWKSQ